MNRLLLIFSLVLAVVISGNPDAFAAENAGVPVQKETNKRNKLSSGCDAATAGVDLDINNVRARIMNGGDMWWDLVGSPRYEVPKVTEQGAPRRHSMFAGALWIGGYDPGRNLRLAAMTYRQSGSDFWPGPLDTSSGNITPDVCKDWDRIFKISRAEIERHIADPSTPPAIIRDWPAHGNTSRGQAKYLAPFVDVSGTGEYEPLLGDYPDVFGDQTLWYIYNDKGNIHDETGADAIGLEIQTQAFAFATNDEINNMTFYHSRVTNRSRDAMDSVYFGQWADPDLGYAYDDYVGSDITRNLGYCYNGTNFDPGVNGYGANPPSVGIAFFEGPRDEHGNPIGLTYFVYYNNDFSVTGNPQQAIHYYYYLTGRWKDGQHITDAIGGRGPGNPVNFMWPDDPRNAAGWSEVTDGNPPGDRRFIQSAGPFRLEPGAVNNVVTGVVWARASTGGATGSLDLLKLATDKAQRLYDNDFQILDGPDAPDVEIVELDRHIVLNLVNTNRKEVEKYEGILWDGLEQIIYRFQGYRIFQLKNPQVSVSELGDPEKARQIAQVDIRDGIATLVNVNLVPGLGEVPQLMVEGEDKGIKHSFVFSRDHFRGGDDSLINFKSYYYLVLSYAYGEDDKEPYLAGRRNIRVYTAIPHKSTPREGGVDLRSFYGDGPELKRMEGVGNTGRAMDLTNETVNQILTSNTHSVPHPVYKRGRGPVDVKVVNPFNVPNAEFKLLINDTTLGPNVANRTMLNDTLTRWMLINTTTNDTVFSDTTVLGNNEQIISKWGLSVRVNSAHRPGNPTVDPANGFIEATINFENPGNRWLRGIVDQEASGDFTNPYNWIRSGRTRSATTNRGNEDAFAGNPVVALDPNEVYENLLGGTVAPYGLTARSYFNNATGAYTFGPAFETTFNNRFLENLQSVDLVFTPDKSKWTRCIVVEMGEDPGNNIGGVRRFGLRQSPSIDQDGNPDGSGTVGFSWFPGYAINIETGERLNIIFGEDSYLRSQNGADMMWNPTANEMRHTGQSYFDRYLLGGKHYIYIMGTQPNAPLSSPAVKYDGGATYHSLLNTPTPGPNSPSTPNITNVFSSAMWVKMPLAATNTSILHYRDGAIPTETKIRLRVSRPLATYNPGEAPSENGNQPFYKFSTEDMAPAKTQRAREVALDLINVVPNPFYATSEYDQGQLDNRVRITNLPPKCDIYIYTLNGTLVRKFRRDEAPGSTSTFLDWDLRNQAMLPISSGVYLIHIDAGELGKKTLRWFGVLRPVDLDTF